MGRGAIRKFGAMGGRVWKRVEGGWRGWLAVELSENCCITDDGSVRAFEMSDRTVQFAPKNTPQHIKWFPFHQI
jgi:hypothetical protein